MAKGLLRGITPPRPLFVPIVFSLGAKVENIPLGVFLRNPAKISSSLRQMGGALGTDGVACYFDPCLEVEALGATLQRPSDVEAPKISWIPPVQKGEFPANMRSPEEAAKNGRVPIAVEVIRRMNALPNRDYLLMAGVTGPMTLAALMCQFAHDELRHGAALSPEVQELAAAITTQMASTFVEAGGELILIQEGTVPVRSAKAVDGWANLLAPAINIVRFYEAVPVVQLLDVQSVLENWDAIIRRQWDCVVSLPVEALVQKRSAGPLDTNGAMLGIALSLETFRATGSDGEALRQVLSTMISELRPAILTTAGDVPVKTDMKQLIKVLEGVPRAV
jgi:hypothetical protein